jgi:hypothetical protein
MIQNIEISPNRLVAWGDGQLHLKIVAGPSDSGLEARR